MGGLDASSVAPDAQAILTIDLAALARNWRTLSARAGAAACGAAVKADAYGIGITEAVPALARAGCRDFFVAHAAEGVRARTALRAAGHADPDTRIFVLNGFHPGSAPAELYVANALRPVLGSAEEIVDWSVVVAGRGTGEGASALHVDTGLNRLGLPPREAATLHDATIRATRAELVMSHFCTAEEPENSSNAAQVAAFEAVRRGPLGRLPASLANSSGLFLPQPVAYDLVRPGYALYGGNPTPGRPNPMEPVVTLEARLLQVRAIEPGQSAGYGSLWTATRPTRLATIGIGYADGLPRGARTVGNGEGPRAMVGGVPCPLVGRVSMDLSILDVTDASEAAARPGGTATLLGAGLTVDDLARGCGTIGYEILTGLGRRYRRGYSGDQFTAS